MSPSCPELRMSETELSHLLMGSPSCSICLSLYLCQEQCITYLLLPQNSGSIQHPFITAHKSMGPLGTSDQSQTQLILARLFHTSGASAWAMALTGPIWSLSLQEVSLSLLTWQMGRVSREKEETIQGFWKPKTGTNTFSLPLYSVGGKSQSHPRFKGWRSTHHFLMEEAAKSIVSGVNTQSGREVQ